MQWRGVRGGGTDEMEEMNMSEDMLDSSDFPHSLSITQLLDFTFEAIEGNTFVTHEGQACGTHWDDWDDRDGIILGFSRIILKTRMIAVFLTFFFLSLDFFLSSHSSSYKSSHCHPTCLSVTYCRNRPSHYHPIHVTFLS